jgi:hypothetical protein
MKLKIVSDDVVSAASSTWTRLATPMRKTRLRSRASTVASDREELKIGPSQGWTVA